MGLFYRSLPLRDVLAPTIARALATDPKTVADPSQLAAQQAGQVAQSVGGVLVWPRLVAAVGFLVLVFAGAVYTGHDAKLQDLYGALVHLLQLGAGGVIGALAGEAASRG